MFERFTDAARIAMANANRESERRNCTYIGDVELLLGLTKDSLGLCHRVLSRIGIDISELRQQLDQLPCNTNDANPPLQPKRRLTNTPKLAIEAAIAIARDYDHKHIGTEHLLLGILHHPDFASSRVLANHSVSFDRVKQTIADLGFADTQGEK